jgi:dTMP kinase
MPPLFIAIEGIDGSGGTTQARLLADALQAAGRAVHRTAEPSTGPVGRFLRQVLAPDSPESRLGDAVLPYLFAADRRDHLDREIVPALLAGRTVVSDRYYHSSLAYQSAAVGLQAVAALNQDFRAPDLTVVLDLEPEECLARIQARGGAPERFEALDRLRTIRDAYESVIVLCRARGERIERVDARGSAEEVAARVGAALAALQAERARPPA